MTVLVLAALCALVLVLIAPVLEERWWARLDRAADRAAAQPADDNATGEG